jgi:hypothetical protein
LLRPFVVRRLQKTGAVAPGLMKKKLLLVTDNNEVIARFKRELLDHNVQCEVQVACKTVDALSNLLGCSPHSLHAYSQTGKVQPNVVVLDTDSECVDVSELISVFRNYYSLQRIRIFLLGQSTVPDIAKYTQDGAFISGYLQSPFSFELGGREAEKLRNELRSGSLLGKLLLIAPVDFFNSFAKRVLPVKYAVGYVAVTVSVSLVGSQLVNPQHRDRQAQVSEFRAKHQHQKPADATPPRIDTMSPRIPEEAEAPAATPKEETVAETTARPLRQQNKTAHEIAAVETSGGLPKTPSSDAVNHAEEQVSRPIRNFKIVAIEDTFSGP